MTNLNHENELNINLCRIILNKDAKYLFCGIDEFANSETKVLLLDFFSYFIDLRHYRCQCYVNCQISQLCPVKVDSIQTLPNQRMEGKAELP